jgi:hypothetical protein
MLKSHKKNIQQSQILSNKNNISIIIKMGLLTGHNINMRSIIIKMEHYM